MIQGKKRFRCNKVCFQKHEAELCIQKNKKSSKQYRKEIRIYYCDIHNAWHLTSEEQEEDLDIKIKYKKKWKRLLVRA